MKNSTRARVKRLGGPIRFFARTQSIPPCASKLGGYTNVWSVRINEQYRAVGERNGDTIIWVWVGSHNDFENMFG